MVNRYYEQVLKVLEQIEKTQRENLERAAELIFGSLSQGGVLHLFGTGHSSMIVEEAFHRAGGLAPVNGMLETFLSPHYPPAKAGKLERLEGLAAAVLDYYEPKAGEVILLISNSGINAVPVEMALESKRRGLHIIAITSLSHSKTVAPRHPSGKRLFELAEVVIDNCGVPGDASLSYENFSGKTGPTSTLAGIFIINTLLHRIVEKFLENGLTPPIYLSANVPGGDEYNQTLEAKYKARIKLL